MDIQTIMELCLLFMFFILQSGQPVRWDLKAGLAACERCSSPIAFTVTGALL